HVTVQAGPNKIAVLTLMGRVFMLPIDCPFRKADDILPELRKETPIVLVDMHCEATSESLAMGWYLDGRASAVVGTHRHVQTADERVLPGGTAYITDLGLTGPTDGVIGVDRDQIIQRFLNQMPIRFETAKGPAALQGVVIVIEPATGSSTPIRRCTESCSSCRCRRGSTRTKRSPRSRPRRTPTACTRRTWDDCSRARRVSCPARRPAAWRSSTTTAATSRAPRRS